MRAQRPIKEREAEVLRQALKQECWELVRHFDALLDKPMLALAFIWLGLLILEFTTGLNRSLHTWGYVIWALFILDFAAGITVAPRKGQYLRSNWLTVIPLFLPAFRVLRVFRALRLLRAPRAARSLSLLRLVTSLNRSIGAAGGVLVRRGAGYVVALTLIVTFACAAGMAYFENPAALHETR